MSKSLEYLIIIGLIILSIFLLYLLKRTYSHRDALEKTVTSQQQTISKIQTEKQDFYLKVARHCQSLEKALHIQVQSIYPDTVFSMLSEHCSDVENLMKSNLECHVVIDKISSEKQTLCTTVEQLKSEIDKLQSEWNQLSSFNSNSFQNCLHDCLKSTPAFGALCQLDRSTLVSRVQSALNARYPIRRISFDISFDVFSDSGNVYHTTLYSCTCPDFQRRKQPCKHMFYIALCLRLLRPSDIPDFQEVVKSLSELYKKEKELQQRQHDIQTLTRENSQRYPWLAKLYADYFYTFDDRLANYMYSKSNPARTSAEKLRRIAKELQEVRTKCKEYEYQLHYLESVFPKLKEYCKENPIAFYESRKSKSRKG